MTLGRLMELYQAEQQGKQIMMRVHHFGYYESREYTEEVKITECDLKDFLDKEDTFNTFFIKDEEDEFGSKIEGKMKGE